MKERIAALAVAAVLGTNAANAHHSFARFDSEKEIVLTGTVEEFHFVNPHSQIKLATGEDGRDVWDIECGSVNNMVRAGWRKNTLSHGDKILITVHPARDESQEASLMLVTEINGESVAFDTGRTPEIPAN